MTTPTRRGLPDFGRLGVSEVLFVCVHNAGRSQMAAALLAPHGQDRVVVRCAGSTPADEVNPAVEEALHEIGVPLTDAYPKPLTEEVVQVSDVVITMGCGAACPIYPGKRYLDSELDDPAGLPVERVRAIRDDSDHQRAGHPASHRIDHAAGH
ncbi:MAG: arsenate reductase ArsC [Actinomycetota bacterium]|nr:arsenate reductase ArsC [Actinomycetota bacterium]